MSSQNRLARKRGVTFGPLKGAPDEIRTDPGTHLELKKMLDHFVEESTSVEVAHNLTDFVQNGVGRVQSGTTIAQLRTKYIKLDHLISAMLNVAPPYSLDTSNYSYSMLYNRMITIDGANKDGGTFLAFVGDEVRGMASGTLITGGTNIGRVMFPLRVYANATGETVSFKYSATVFTTSGTVLTLSEASPVSLSGTASFIITIGDANEPNDETVQTITN